MSQLNLSLVFVYGTLRQGESNHGLLAESERLGVTQTPPHYTLYDLGPYPAAIPGHQAIIGEVYRVNDTTLNALDELEEVPVEYRREQVETAFGRAWIYLYQDESVLHRLITSGDWLSR